MVNPSAIVKSLVSEPSARKCVPISTVLMEIGLALVSVVSAVSERFVFVLVQELATSSVPPREIVVSEVVNAAPVTAVPPAGRVSVPPCIFTVPSSPQR